MTWNDLAILALATFYSTEVITRQAGPFRIFERLRTRYPVGLLTCAVCCAPYAAAALWGLYHFCAGPVIVLALAGSAVLLDRFTD